MAEEYYFVDPLTLENVGEQSLYPSERDFAELILSKGSLALGNVLESTYEEVGSDGRVKEILKRPDFTVFNLKKYGLTQEDLIDPTTGKYRIRWGDPRWSVVEHTVSRDLNERKRKQQRAMEETGLRNCVIKDANIRSMNRSTVDPSTKDSFLYKRNTLERMFGGNSLAANPHAEHLKRKVAETGHRLRERIDNLRDTSLTDAFVETISSEAARGIPLKEIYRMFGTETGNEILSGVIDNSYPCMELFSYKSRSGNKFPSDVEASPVRTKSKKQIRKQMKTSSDIHTLRLKNTEPGIALEHDCPRCELVNRCQLRELLQNKTDEIILNREINTLIRRDQLRNLYAELQKLAISHIDLSSMPDSVEVARRFYGIETVDESIDMKRIRELGQIMRQDLLQLRGSKYIESKRTELEEEFKENPILINRGMCIEWLKAIGHNSKYYTHELIKRGMIKEFGSYLTSSSSDILVQEFRQASRSDKDEIVSNIDLDSLFENSANMLFAKRWNRYVFNSEAFSDMTDEFNGKWSPRKVRMLITTPKQPIQLNSGDPALVNGVSIFKEHAHVLFNKEP